MGSYFLSSSALHPITNMKFLVLAACVAVCSAQGFYGLQSHPNGAVTPIDEPAVAAARADHLATKFGAGLGYAGFGYASNGVGLGYAGYAVGYSGYSGLRYTGYAPNYAAGSGYAAARADHLESKGVSYAAVAPAVVAVPAPPVESVGYSYDGPLNLNTKLVSYLNGAVVPADEPAVAAARADHLASKGAVYAAAPVEAVGYGYNGPLNLNTELVSYSNGALVPADEPAVVSARADHLASRGPAYAAAVPVANSGYTYTGPLNLNSQLVDYPNGAVVPVDEPAVAAARADHLASKGVYGGVASKGY